MSLLLNQFRFVNHGPLVDRELELVQPQRRWFDDVLYSCRDPWTQQSMPRESRLTRDELNQFLNESPLGRYPGDEWTGRSPAYHFWMLLRHDAEDTNAPPPLRIAGGMSVRVGKTHAVEQYYGHLGYHVYPACRGRHYALRGCRLVLPILKAHGVSMVWITCDPDNYASRRTIELLGASYVETVDVPVGDPLHARGETRKARYRLMI